MTNNQKIFNLEEKTAKMKIKTLKTYAFIDATNIIYGASNHGWKVDFKKHSYAGVDNENLKQLNFYEKLREFGYLLRLVPVKKFKDGRKKADVDSRMTFEMMKYINEYEKVIVFNGDGDFYWVLEYLLTKKQDIKLIAHTKSTAKELKQLFGGNFTDINKIKYLIVFKQKNKADAKVGSAFRDYAKRIAKNNKKSQAKNMTYQIDQSGKIEQTNKNTVLAMSNKKQYAIVIPRKIKRQLQEIYRRKGLTKFFVYQIFTLGIYFLLEPLKRTSKIIIDTEYPGKNKVIASFITVFLAINKKPIHEFYFKRIGNKPRVHYAAHDVFVGKKKADKILTLNEILKTIKKADGRLNECLSTRFGARTRL